MGNSKILVRSFLIDCRVYIKTKKPLKRVAFDVVIPEGFEPSTYALEVRCSIQLSYGTKKFFIKNI